jgi:hypothetical protein
VEKKMSFKSRKSKAALVVEEKMSGTERARRATGVPDIFYNFFYHLPSLFCKKNIFTEELWEDDQYA